MRVIDLCVEDVNELVRMVFSGLPPQVVEDVADEGERIAVRARAPQEAGIRPVCGASAGRAHGYHWRTAADVPVDDRRVVVHVRVRRLVCPTRGRRQTFREQMPGVLERYQRRTARLTRQVKARPKEAAATISLLRAPWASYDAHVAGSAPPRFEGIGCAPPAVVQARV